MDPDDVNRNSKDRNSLDKNSPDKKAFVTNRVDAQAYMTIDAFDVVISDGADGVAIVSKDHSGPLPGHGRTAAEHTAAMERERSWLRRAAGISGVVRLVEDSARVVTEFAGSPTLRSNCPGPRPAALHLAAVASIIAELAERGLVHGAIAPEHIILGGSEVHLCSPSSARAGADAAEPDPSGTIDLLALGRCIEFVTEQWDDPPENITQWLVLAKRLRDADPTLSPERVADMLSQLATPPASPAWRRRWPGGAPAVLHPAPRSATLRFGIPVSGMAALALALLWLAGAGAGRSGHPDVTGPEVTIAGSRLRAGRAGDVVLAQPADPCTEDRVLVLEPDSSRIWAFERLATGAVGSPLARVPGATNLELVQEGGCSSVVATGPAGRVVLRR